MAYFMTPRRLPTKEEEFAAFQRKDHLTLEKFVADFDTMSSKITRMGGNDRHRYGHDITICLDSIGVRPEEVDRVILTLYEQNGKIMVANPTEFTFDQLLKYFGYYFIDSRHQLASGLAMYYPTFILKNGDMYHMIDQEHAEFGLVYPASTLESFDEDKVYSILHNERRPRR